MRSKIAGAVAIAILAGADPGGAATFTVSSQAEFAARTTGQTTTGFNSVGPLQPETSASFSPLIMNGVGFWPTVDASVRPPVAENVNVNSANFHGPGDLSTQYLTGGQTLTIALPSSVTAFGLNYGTGFNSAAVTFGLSQFSNNFAAAGPTTIFEGQVISTFNSVISIGVDINGNLTNTLGQSFKTLAASSDAFNAFLFPKFILVGPDQSLGATDPNDLSFLHLTDEQLQLALDGFPPSGGAGPLAQLVSGADVFSTVVDSTLPNLQTQFLGFISTDPFNTIRLTVPDGSTWVVQDFTTASVSAVPLPAALPLFATGLAGLGLLGWRRKRKAASAAA